MLFELILAVLIGAAHYISDKVCLICSTLKNSLISLIAGVSIAYIFLNLFPEFYKSASLYSPLMYTSVFLGFAVFHIIDKEIYQKIHHSSVKNDIRIAHGLGLVLYYFVVGIVLVELASLGVKTAFLFFVPVFTYASMSAFSTHSIHGLHGPHHDVFVLLNLVQSLAVITGAVVTLVFTIPFAVATYFTGVVAGLLTYIIVRDMLPREKKGDPLLFILGALSYSSLIVWLWFI